MSQLIRMTKPALPSFCPLLWKMHGAYFVDALCIVLPLSRGSGLFTSAFPASSGGVLFDSQVVCGVDSGLSLSLSGGAQWEAMKELNRGIHLAAWLLVCLSVSLSTCLVVHLSFTITEQ